MLTAPLSRTSACHGLSLLLYSLRYVCKNTNPKLSVFKSKNWVDWISVMEMYPNVLTIDPTPNSSHLDIVITTASMPPGMSVSGYRR